MLVEELKGAMWNNALVRYQGGLYEISAAIYKFDRKEQQFYYRLELKDTKANSSLIYCRPEDVELTNIQGGAFNEQYRRINRQITNRAVRSSKTVRSFV